MNPLDTIDTRVYNKTREFLKTGIFKSDDSRIPSQNGLRIMMRRYVATGDVYRDAKGGRPRKLLESNLAEVWGSSEPSTLRDAQRALANTGTNVSTSTISLAGKRFGYKSYVVQTTPHSLTVHHLARRFNFARECLDRLKKDHNGFTLDKIIFSDESMIHVGRHHNASQVFAHRLKGAPPRDEHRVVRDKNANKVHVFMAMNMNLGLIGPYFIDADTISNEGKNNPSGKTKETCLNAPKYQDLLSNLVFPDIQRRIEDLGHDIKAYHFQQDGAAAHTAKESIRMLRSRWGNRTITSENWRPNADGGDTVYPKWEWPPYSPDLTPLDYSLWNCLKTAVGKMEPSSVEGVKMAIKFCVKRFPLGKVQNIIKDFPFRLGCCVAYDGEHIEGRRLDHWKTQRRREEEQATCPKCGKEHTCYCDACIRDCRIPVDWDYVNRVVEGLERPEDALDGDYYDECIDEADIDWSLAYDDPVEVVV